jgi:hypothetical protein
MGVSLPIALAIQALLTVDGGVPSIAPDTRVSRPRCLLDPLPGLRVPPPEDVYQLRESNDGTDELVYEETTFVARVARDGAVRFQQRRVFGLRLFPVLPKRGVQLGVPSLQSSLTAVLRGRTPAPPALPDDGSPPPETTTLIPETSRYRPDPREGCRHCGPLPPVQLNVTWRLDITDELMRMNGQDPYRYQKAKFLVATHDLRAHMAAKMHAERIRRASAELPSRLLSIACDERLSPRDPRGAAGGNGHEHPAGTRGG